MRTIDWVDGMIRTIDQTRLPEEEFVLCLSTVEELAEAISSLRVRGPPALGVAGGLGIALVAQRAQENGEDVGEAISRAASLLASTRPTAVNLKWGIERIKKIYDPAHPRTVDELIEQARAMVAEDEKINRIIGEVGADLLTEGSRVLTHCNAGALACVAHGTALSVVKVAHQRGLIAAVTATETRPLLQGSRLTAWELKRMGVPHRVTIDSAAGLIASGDIDFVITGADRTAVNGDVANKVGTYPPRARRASERRAVYRGGALVHDRSRDPQRRRYPHRAAIRLGGARSQRGAGRSGGYGGLQPGVRRHAGEPRLGYCHRARRRPSRRG